MQNVQADIVVNGTPMIWVTVDEARDPNTGDYRMRAFHSPEFKDFLMPLEDFDGSVPKGYWDNK